MERAGRRRGRAALALILMLVGTRPARAYIGGPPASLGMMCSWSTHVVVARVEKLDREKNVLLFRKVQDLKGRWPADLIRQNIPAGLPDRGFIAQWAVPGRTTVICALESYKWSHTYVDGLWYAANTGDWQWWNVSHPEPILLRTYSGRADRLVSAAAAILAGREVVAPCLVGDNPEDLRLRRAKVQRLRASLKLLDYNPRRDFLGWGSDDMSPLAGMAGFTHSLTLSGVGADAQAIAAVDFNGDGRTDLCLAGPGRVLLASNNGDYFTEIVLPPSAAGGRAAVWADSNDDGKPDLFLATLTGPRLFTNLGNGAFRDDSALLPREPAYNLTAAVWIDYDGDGRPDLLLGNGFHGLRLYRNLGQVQPALAPVPAPAPKPGQPPVAVPPAPAFEDVSDAVGLGVRGAGSSRKGDTLTVCDVDGDGRPDFLYGAGTGLLVLNTPKGFVEVPDSGIAYRTGGVGPVFGDFDSDGRPDLFVPQDGGCKLFRNDGKGHFTDVTEKTGLAGFTGTATCAAWGDLDNDGQLDLVVGCLRGPNRYFRNTGDGAFEDATERVGLHKRIFNTQAICLADLNNDGVLDVVFNNEGQEAVVMLGSPALAAKRTPVSLQVAGSGGVIGSRVRLLDPNGRLLAAQQVSGGDGRGGQAAPVAHFALAPGTYRVEVEYSSGLRRVRPLEVARGPVRGVIDDSTPRAE